MRTGSLSRAAVVLINEEVLRLDQETTLKLSDVPLDVEQPSLLDLATGAVQSFSRSPRKVNVDTSYMTLAIRGTEFIVRVEEGRSLLTVFEGEVLASNAQGEVPVPRGQSVVATPGQAPQPFLIARPRDAAQWSLFYPPIFSAPPGDAPDLGDAQRLAAGGDIAGALVALDQAAGWRQRCRRADLSCGAPAPGRPRRRGPHRDRCGAGGRSRTPPTRWRCGP